jgi:hypothetical protein
MDSKEQSKITADKPQNSEVEIRLARYTGWLVAATIALGLFTAVLAYIGFQQICISEKSFKDQSTTNREMVDRMDSQISVSRDEERKSLRAYLTIEGLWPSSFTLKRDAIEWKTVNSGHTPAYSVITLFNDTIREFPLRGNIKRYYPINPSAGSTIIGPGETPITGIDRDTLKKFTHSDSIGFRNGTITRYIYGEVRYVDAFDSAHVTRFQAYLGRDGEIYETKYGNDAPK